MKKEVEGEKLTSTATFRKEIGHSVHSSGFYTYFPVNQLIHVIIEMQLNGESLKFSTVLFSEENRFIPNQACMPIKRNNKYFVTVWKKKKKRENRS
jgi:hypothetical protein